MKLSKAMILAAGYGTRLKPHTDFLPKALVQYKHKPMIENVIDKLISAGIGDITINTHYLAGKIAEFIDRNKFNAKINLTFEKEILGIGGGIKNAKKYLEHSGNFLVHNVDVDSDINIKELYDFHIKKNAIASLCVNKRETTRHLLIDKNYNLIGRISNKGEEFYKNTSDYSKIAFCGVYILAERVFDLFPSDDKFDIIPFILGMVKKGELVICYDIGDTYWKDVGKIEDLD